MTNSRFFQLSVFSMVMMFASFGSAQTLSVLYNFGSASGDPLNPQFGAIAQGRDGNLYTTAPNGGVDGADGGTPVCCGAAFKITPDGTLTTLHDFTGGVDGGTPTDGLTLGTDGNLYGTTLFGGANNYGTIFKITPQGDLTTLYSFTDGMDGAYPNSAPIEGANGEFYGTTSEGGVTTCEDGDGCGTLYKITSAGAFTTFFQFDSSNGYGPTSLTLGTNGDFYGIATGSTGLVVFFKITPAAKLTILHTFTNTESVLTPLVQGSDGNFYGVSDTGPGTHGHGLVFKLTPSGKFTNLHSMSPTSDGEEPVGLMQATDGNFYGVNAYGGPANSACEGVSCGTLFQITSAGDFSVLYYFNSTNGGVPEVAPLQHTSGVFYADTEIGGSGTLNACSANGCGVFYSWKNASVTPFVSLLPYSGKVGATIEFLGQGFVPGETTVSFNGTAAAVHVVSSTYLTAKVPEGATTGLVTVTTSGNSLTSNKTFRVIP
jgi:uncharacterized repeat protein (TIGR03803 family)